MNEIHTKTVCFIHAWNSYLKLHGAEHLCWSQKEFSFNSPLLTTWRILGGKETYLSLCRTFFLQKSKTKNLWVPLTFTYSGTISTLLGREHTPHCLCLLSSCGPHPLPRHLYIFRAFSGCILLTQPLSVGFYYPHLPAILSPHSHA